MKILLSQIDGHWTAEVDSKVHILKAADTVKLTQVVAGIHRYYPKAQVFLNKSISNNPFLHNALDVGARYFSEPIWRDIEMMLEKPSSKICNRCETEAWYDATVKKYRCPKCKAFESLIDEGRFFKVIVRRDKWKY